MKSCRWPTNGRNNASQDEGHKAGYQVSGDDHLHGVHLRSGAHSLRK